MMGDLFVFAGFAAILQGGRPVGEICAGRNDNSTCNIQDNCTSSFGPAQGGLIYVNAQGNVNANSVETAAVREVFGESGAVALLLGCFSNYQYKLCLYKWWY